jgi:hypothetical protein
MLPLRRHVASPLLHSAWYLVAFMVLASVAGLLMQGKATMVELVAVLSVAENVYALNYELHRFHNAFCVYR